METSSFAVVTGAFSYTGKYITRRLLNQGRRVITLTGHPERSNEFGGRVPARSFNFDQPAALEESLRGAEVLYNTYWVRFSHDDVTFERAVENTRRLITAAKNAGVRRIVHVSITNPSVKSNLPYFRGKAILEDAIRASGLSYAILRPTVIFGDEDILINNIAYLLRRFPFFAVPGTGQYRLQPVFVEDFAELVVQQGSQSEDVVLDAVGPRVYTFNELVQLIGNKIGRSVRLVHVPPTLALWLSRLLGTLVGDVLLTRDELDGLMQELLVSEQSTTGQTRLEEWLENNAAQVGRRYASELNRH
ncbi:MAG: NAD(P)H-binding protein, partial [Acidobacteriaceae bacterium]